MTDTKDLRMRLRLQNETTWRPYAMEAADCIEALEAKIASLPSWDSWSEILKAGYEMKARAEAAEAKLAKAVEALESAKDALWQGVHSVGDEDWRGTPQGCRVPVMGHFEPYHKIIVGQLLDAANGADAILRELKGGDLG